jgi:hypothetical protein
MTKRERYIKNQEEIKTRAIYRIFQKQKKRLVEMLEKESKGFRLTVKGIDDDIIDPFIDDSGEEIPEYLLEVLPKIMEE